MTNEIISKVMNLKWAIKCKNVNYLSVQIYVYWKI